jgi:hypothetical protein
MAKQACGFLGLVCYLAIFLPKITDYTTIVMFALEVAVTLV